jgi:hypothetical protein
MSGKRGRPKGSPNIAALAEVAPSRCPVCGSSRRTKYENPERRDYSGQGLEFVAIVYRTCRCLDCGQARRDQEKVFAPTRIALTYSTPPEMPVWQRDG